VISDLLAALRGIRPPVVAERPLRELNAFEQRMTILRAKWDRERPNEPEEQETVIVYTGLSALEWLRRTEVELGRPVTTAEIISRRAGVKYPSTLSCKRLAHTLRRFGARSEKVPGQRTHLRWSAR
jgi:hypothetical protein